MSNARGTSESGKVGAFQVVELGGASGPDAYTVLWEVRHPDRRAVEIEEIRYGVVPGAFVEVVPPAPLRPGGRYLATGGSAGVEFRVQPGGGVVAFRPDTASDRFVEAGLEKEEVRRFWDRMKAAFAGPDPERVAELIRYPLHVETPDSAWEVPDSASLVRTFDAVFRREEVARVQDEALDEAIVTWRGVMVGLGRVQIGAICGAERSQGCPAAIYRVEHYPESGG
jgi:hypothetical protein